MPTRFEERMGVMWDDGSGYRHGVVIRSDDTGVTVVPVFDLDNNMRCFDEGRSIRERDEHNVRLKSCPPPFTLLCAFAERDNGCYAYADPGSMCHMSIGETSAYGMIPIDDGAKISERDMADIKDHPWRDEKQADRKDWRSFAAEPKFEPAPARPKPMSTMDRLRAAAALTDGIAERDAGPEGPGF